MHDGACILSEAMSITPINKQNILWFVPVIILWTIIILPSSFDAVWGSLDDGVTLVMGKGSFWNSFYPHSGRIFPAYWLHNYLLYHIVGINPNIWYFVQSIEFLVSAIFIYISLLWLTEKAWCGFLGLALLLTTSPISENAYTISKGEPRIVLFFSAIIFLLVAYLKKAKNNSTYPFSWRHHLHCGLVFLVVSLLAIYTKETAVTILLVGIVGLIVIYFSNKEIKLHPLTGILWNFTMAILLAVVFWLCIKIWVLHRSNEYDYTRFIPTWDSVIYNLRFYVFQLQDILILGVLGIIAGLIILHKLKKINKHLMPMMTVINILGWGSYISGITYFCILILWRWPTGYYMLPVSLLFIISFVLFTSALLRICIEDKVCSNRLLVFTLTMLIIGISTRAYSIPYIYYIAKAQRGFDKIETQVQMESMEILNEGGRIVDLNRLWFVEQPIQRNLLFSIFGRPDLRWIGAGELFFPYSEDTRKLFHNTSPPELERNPLHRGDIILVHDLEYPFPITLRGIGPSPIVNIKEAEALTGWMFTKIKKWEKSSIVFNPWTFRQGKLVFRSVLYQVIEPLHYRIKWEGRYSDHWIGDIAKLTFHAENGYPLGNLHIRAPNHQRVLPIKVTIQSEKTMSIILDGTNLQVRVPLSKILSGSAGCIYISVSKTWQPIDIIKDNPDTRVLGVQVEYEPGEISMGDQRISGGM